jgi:hypothetical protein
MKWIMVNIMNSQEFSCQVLNRDLWSDKEVQKTVREHFYFLQVSSQIVFAEISSPMTKLKGYDIKGLTHLTNIHILELLIHGLVWSTN